MVQEAEVQNHEDPMLSPRAENLTLRFGGRSVVEVEGTPKRKQNQSRSVKKSVSSPGFLSGGVFRSCFPEASLTAASNSSGVLPLNLRLRGD